MWFQQDATSLTTQANRALLQEKVPGRLILRLGDVNLEFLWGYAKYRVYLNNPQNLEHLNTNIREFMAETSPQTD